MMEHVTGMLLAAALLYVGIAIQTYLDLLLDQRARRENFGLGSLVLFAKSFLWPLVLMDKVRINGLMTRAEAAAHSGELSAAVGVVNGGMREAQQARMEKMKEELTEKVEDKNREKRKKKKRKKRRKK